MPQKENIFEWDLPNLIYAIKIISIVKGVTIKAKKKKIENWVYVMYMLLTEQIFNETLLWNILWY